jgi:hypothetical protein
MHPDTEFEHGHTPEVGEIDGRAYDSFALGMILI